MITKIDPQCSKPMAAGLTVFLRVLHARVRSQPTRVYHQRNRQYSIVGLANAAGALVERYSYSAYGTLGIYDADLRLYHFRARWYDPATGGFISRDPLGYIDGMSLYRGYFAPKYRDPYGELLRVADDRKIKKGVKSKGPRNTDAIGIPVAQRDGCCYVFLWIPESFMEFGHAAIYCPNFYVSFWPESGGAKLGSDPSVWLDYGHDEAVEKREPDEIIELCCVDIAKMKAEFQNIKAQNLRFELIGQNCSTIAGKVLFAGVDTTTPQCKFCEKLDSCFSWWAGICGPDKPSTLRYLAKCLKRRNCKAWACVPDGKHYPPTDRADPNPWGRGSKI